jgi:hypothetical protein
MRPVLLGLTAGVLIIVLVNFALRAFRSPRHGRWTSCVLFAVCAAGFGAGIAVETRPLLRVAYALTSGLLVYAIVATVMRWPGFRPQPPQDDDEEGDSADA